MTEYNKVVYDGNTLIDLTNDDVTESDVLAGVYFHKADGTRSVGTLNVVDMFYPIGSYYETSDTTFDPNVSWGGTWVLETEGQVHVSGSPSGTYQVNGATTDTTDGGATTHQHTTGNFTLGTSHIPAHTHGSKSLSGTIYMTGVANATVGTTGIISNSAGSTVNYTGNSSNSRAVANITVNATHEHTSVGGGSAHNHGNTGDGSNLQPYIIVNRWHRTA